MEMVILQANILDTKYPLIQGPMNWVTNAELVAAVSNGGGLGVLGTNAGQATLTTEPTAVGDKMRREIDKTQRLTQLPFGINILTNSNDEKLQDEPYTAALLTAAFDAGIHYFVVVGTENQEIFDLIKQHDGVIIFRPLTSSVALAKAGEAMGADIIVATGHDEGGLLPDTELGNFTIVPEIVDQVSVAVFAAGGINDRRSVEAALALGAAGIFVGTRFLVATEAPVAPSIKELIVQSNSEDTVMVSGNQRAIRTPHTQQLADQYLQSHDAVAANRAVAQDGGLLEGMLLGNPDHGIVTVNNGIGMIKRIEPAAAIINSYFK